MQRKYVLMKNVILLITMLFSLIVPAHASNYECTLKLAPGKFKVVFSKGKMGKGLAKIVSNGVSYKAKNGKWYTLTSNGTVVHARNVNKRGGYHWCELKKARAAVAG